MNLMSLYLRVVNGTLTCSEVMGVLMSQPTTPVGQNIESHAHMHVQDGFTLQKPAAMSNADFALKRAHWEQPSHLYPATHAMAGRQIGGPAVLGSPNVVQDPNRLPPNRSYADRTGLGLLPREVHPPTFEVFRKNAGAKPTLEPVADRATATLLPQANYVAKNNVIQVKETPGALRYPEVKASPAHTLFSDSESQVMHLTAALLSEAGKKVLHNLFFNLPNGSPITNGIFSRTAVRVVSAHNAAVANRLVERKLEVDQTQPRSNATGQYPATGNILTASHGIDHVVVILGRSATGTMNVITCYPSQRTTGDTIGTATHGFEDIAEFQLGVHQLVAQPQPDFKLKW